ncbi:hypothetical protein RIF29_33431 [Crotalaria pallida]|uniref:Uncharacterized protein n=1 Tax=Crotalaria pallida TaxID=3830 RepID=A0AAN9EDN1_CROPI
MACGDEVGRFDRVHSSPSRDRILYAGCSDSSRSLYGGGKNSDSIVLDCDLSVQPENATPKHGTLVSAECVGGKTNKDAQGNLPMIEKNDAANVEVQGMLPMEKNNNADNVEPSPLHQL